MPKYDFRPLMFFDTNGKRVPDEMRDSVSHCTYIEYPVMVMALDIVFVLPHKFKSHGKGYSKLVEVSVEATRDYDTAKFQKRVDPRNHDEYLKWVRDWLHVRFPEDFGTGTANA